MYSSTHPTAIHISFIHVTYFPFIVNDIGMGELGIQTV